MEKLHLIILLTICICLTRSDEALDLGCKILEDGSPLYQLKRYLFCDYDPSIRPGARKNTTLVDFMLVMRKTDFNPWNSELNLHTWLFMQWKDQHLSWKPEDHSDIKLLQVKKSEVWTPEIFTLDPSYGDMGLTTGSNCRLDYKGDLACAPTVVYTLPCESDFTYWPYDTHNCSIRLGAWAYLGEEIKFTNETAAIRHFSQKREEWQVSRPYLDLRTGKSKLSKDKEFEMLVVYFLVSRAESSLKAAVVTPVILLVVITLTTLWMKPGSTERLILCSVNILGHFLAQRNAHWNLPDTGTSVPNIMIFYDNSLILAVLTLVLTCIFQKLLASRREVPIWLASQVAFIITSKAGQVLSVSVMDPKHAALLQEDDDDDNTLIATVEPKKNKWQSVVTVFGWFAFFSFVFIYIVLAAVLLQ